MTAPIKRSLRIVFSLLIVWHLVAVVAPPLAFQARGPLGTSPSVNSVLRPVDAYGQFLYINRGYAFFAPDPGPSHLVQVAVTTNGQTSERMYPDRNDQWPRLMYHRHFMLTEYLEEIYQPPGPPADMIELEPETAELWRRARDRYTQVRLSVTEHLEHENPGSEVAIRRVEHLIPNVIDYQNDPIPLDDQRLYRVLLDDPVDIGAPVATEAIPLPAAEGAPVPAVEGAQGSPANETLPAAQDENDSEDATRTAADDLVAGSSEGVSGESSVEDSP